MLQRSQNGPPGRQSGGTKLPKRHPRGAERGRRQKAHTPRPAAPPKREQGAPGPTHHSPQNLHSSASLPSAAGPSKFMPKMFHVSRLSSSTLFGHARYTKSAKMDSDRDPVWKPTPAKNAILTATQTKLEKMKKCCISGNIDKKYFYDFHMFLMICCLVLLAPERSFQKKAALISAANSTCRCFCF